MFLLKFQWSGKYVTCTEIEERKKPQMLVINGTGIQNIIRRQDIEKNRFVQFYNLAAFEIKFTMFHKTKIVCSKLIAAVVWFKNEQTK